MIHLARGKDCLPPVYPCGESFLSRDREKPAVYHQNYLKYHIPVQYSNLTRVIFNNGVWWLLFLGNDMLQLFYLYIEQKHCKQFVISWKYLP